MVLNKVIYNMVIQMPPAERLVNLLHYRNEKMLDFDNYLYDKYEPINEKLERNHYKYGYHISQPDILNVIDCVTGIDQSHSFSSMNVIYDVKTDKLGIYRVPNWEYYLFDSGLSEIVRTIKSNHLDMYEQHLIKKLTLDHINLVELRDRIEEYYRFITCFDLPPFVKYKNDQEILGTSNYNENDQYSLESHYMNIYKEQDSKITRSDIQQTRRNVAKIVKQNSKSNLEALNREIMNLIKVDEDFRSKFSEKLL